MGLKMSLVMTGEMLPELADRHKLPDDLIHISDEFVKEMRDVLTEASKNLDAKRRKAGLIRPGLCIEKRSKLLS
jgi:hypothetical protein